MNTGTHLTLHSCLCIVCQNAGRLRTMGVRPETRLEVFQQVFYILQTGILAAPYVFQSFGFLFRAFQSWNRKIAT